MLRLRAAGFGRDDGPCVRFWTLRLKDGGGCRLGREGGAWAEVGREVAHGGVDGLEQEPGALEVHVIAGEAGGDLAKSVLDGFTGVEVFEQERIVFEDRKDDVGSVVVTHHLVVHGDGAATGSVLLGGVDALVGFGRFAVHLCIGVGHGKDLGIDT